MIISPFIKKVGNCILAEELSLPATVEGKADMVITDKCVARTGPKGFVITEMAEGVTLGSLQAATDAVLTLSEDWKVMS